MKELKSAVRQYRHNDGSGLVMAYDKTETDCVVSDLLSERNELAAQVERLRGAYNSAKTWEDLGDVLNETPAQSLEAVKREWEAELIRDSEGKQRELISAMIDVERISKDPSAPIVDRLLEISERLGIKP